MTKKEQEKAFDKASKLLVKANKKYTRGVFFQSASGSGMVGKVTGNLILKWVNTNSRSSKKDMEDSKQNGDIVVSNGVGCIYNAKTNTWAKIIKQ